MPKIPFNVDAYTAKLIGRENVSNLEGAILELVKNTYDADASVCLLYYDEETSTLYIGDNGTGMTKEVIEKHWMTIGSSSKKNFYHSKKGRVQTGAKGIGRFALDRVADKCTLLTVSSQQRLSWSVDWSAFEFGQKITEITAELNDTECTFQEFIAEAKSSAAKRFVSEKITETGSLFKLNLLRDNWDTSIIENIRNNLKTLIPPELRDIFNIYFFDNITSEDEAAVLRDDSSFSYDYKIQFNVETDGAVKIKIHRAEFNFKDEFEIVMDEAEFSDSDKLYFQRTPIEYDTDFSHVLKSKSILENTVGSFKGVLYFAKISAAPKDEAKKFYHKDILVRRDMSSTFGGIRIYRDQFRVRPYGDAGTSAEDWLMLSNRKAKSPAGPSHPDGKWRVASNQVFGSVHISRTNLTLQDQANRQGFVETTEFSILKDFLRNILEYVEHDRQKIYRVLDAYHKRKNPTEKIEKALKEFKKSSSHQSVSQTIQLAEVAQLIDTKNEKIKQLQDELQMLRVLATTGIVTNTYVHEIRGGTNKLNMKLVLAEDALNEGEDARDYILDAQDILNNFTSWFKVTVESIRRDKRTRKKVELETVIRQIANNWRDVLIKKSVEIEIVIEAHRFKCFPNDIEAIFSNLITNSASLFRPSQNAKNYINIIVKPTRRGIIIEYSDSGPGLSQIYKKDPSKILEPFESDKRSLSGEFEGTGMGMWIISKIVDSYKGRIDLSKNTDKQQGFIIVIELNER